MGLVIPSDGTIARSSCVALRLDIKSVRMVVQLQQCVPFRPREAAKTRDIVNCSFLCFFRHLERHINQKHVFKGVSTGLEGNQFRRFGATRMRKLASDTPTPLHGAQVNLCHTPSPASSDRTSTQATTLQRTQQERQD